MTSKGEKGILTLYSDVQATSVRWLWYPFIAVGKITLLQGDPGDGKSTMMMNLIAELSKGGKLPDGKAVGLSQRVIYQCSEDGVSDTIKPRLEKCGADCRNVAFINEETYSGLTLDDERIRQAIIEFRPRLVVIDPIQAYLGKGVHIGNNVIIGANSLVNKDIPDNCVAAGNPCKVIMGLEEYHEKRKASQVAEAKELVQLYRERYGRDPDEKALHEFFWLFTDGHDELPECWESMMKLGGNYEYTKEQFKKNNKKFKNMDEFLKQI